MDSKFTNDLQIVLLGSTGTGKSATGNTILMKDVFKVGKSSSTCQKHTAEINGRQVTVIDTPGLFNAKLSNQEIQQKVKNYISGLTMPHVYLSLMTVGHFNAAQENVAMIIQETFGESAMENAMVLFTKGDRLKKITIEHYLLDSKSKISQYLEEYGGRYHVFNNKQRKDTSQVFQLFEKIDKMVADSQICNLKLGREKEEERGKNGDIQDGQRKQDIGKENEQLSGIINLFKKTTKRSIQETSTSQSNHEDRRKFGNIQKPGEKIATEKKTSMQENERSMCEVPDAEENYCTEKKRKKTGKLQKKKDKKLEEKTKEAEIQKQDYSCDMQQNRVKTHEEREDQLTKQTLLLQEKEKQKLGVQIKQAENQKQDYSCEMQQNDMNTHEERKDQHKEQRKNNESNGKQKDCERENENQTMKCEKVSRESCEKSQEKEETWKIKTKEQEKIKEEHNDDSIKDMTMETIYCSERPSSLQTQTTADQISAEIEHITNFFKRLNLENRHHDKLTTADILNITALSLQYQEPQDETELIDCFLQKLLRMNYKARHTCIQHRRKNKETNHLNKERGDIVNMTNYKHKDTNQSEIDLNIHPMDVQMAVFHCADRFLKQFMATKLSQCQYSLPLLVPNPFTQQIDFPLWTFRQISKTWKIKNTSSEAVTKTQPVCKAKTPMVAFFRFGSVSSSKSQLMSSLINEKHDTFFHKNCKGSSRTRVLMDGVVEIAWYCPSGKDTDKFDDCVAFCNLHGDARDNEKQLNILTEMASVNVVLLPQLNRNDINATKIQKIYKEPTTVICLLAESSLPLTVMRKGKYKIGLKDRSQSEVIDELTGAIKEGLSHVSTGLCAVFTLEDVARQPIISDEGDDCRRGKEKAQQMVSLMEKKDLAEIKDSFLPCQGKLWHQWCQKNKELHQPQGDETEIHISNKQSDLEKIREEQQETEISDFMKLFLKEMNSTNTAEKIYFLKWLGILLEERTSEDLSALRLKYHITCSKILKLKERRDKSEALTAEQQGLKAISKKLQAANFGLEHILREIGQIYESCSSTGKNKKGLQCHMLPSLAAEMMISGFPLELMDGDAAHVPLIWVTAVLDELIKKLENPRIFVLSVLGIQSSGKSTLLNTMFGLQFAVSAGRCTRGAFMQLVRVSDEMKQTQMKFDYILVVDTEGLSSPEISGRETRHHDNELATFVAGIGNLTLINIFGESSTEIHNILQIVVQAFLRMKKVKLNSSCMFVHQNVSDTAAEEKTMNGKRTLQKQLDEMTELAAKDEVCDVQCFNDVIQFNVQTDVKYFGQFWEGSPPMAPPSPDYSDSIQDLKRTIISHASQSDGMRLTHLKEHMQDLWNALLNERFVFSFKNSLEIANYRKLETEYSTWSWNLKRFILEIENNLLDKIENGVIHDILDKDFNHKIKEKSWDLKKCMVEFFKKNKNASLLNQWKAFEIKLEELQETTVTESKKKLNEALQQQDLKKKINAQRKHHENILLEKSKNLALTLKDQMEDEKILKETFYISWEQWVEDIGKGTPGGENVDIVPHFHGSFWEANDPVAYFKSKSGEYYGIFKKYCQGATSSAIFGEFICNKLKEPIKKSAYKKAAKELADEMKTNCESFNGNRSKLEKHILEELAEKEDFSMYMKYIHNPREHFKSFIREEVSKYISQTFKTRILPKIKKYIELQQQKILEAAYEASERVKGKHGDVDLWLNAFTHNLSGVLVFSEQTLTGVSHDDVDVNLLEDAIVERLPTFMPDMKEEFNPQIIQEKLNDKERPDEILIEHFCECCWVQCPFCKAICTNTLENHTGDHSVPFHRNIGLNGWYLRGTTNLSLRMCTSEVATDNSFFPDGADEKAIPWKEYKKGGPRYATWSIPPDLSELPYWKWVVCRFQKDLEKYYGKTFQGKGKIPVKWKKYAKQDAIKSLYKNYG